MRRIIEALLAGTALILLAPLLFIIAIIVMIDLGRPVIFWQERAGKGGKPFRIYKFRSMKNLTDDQGNPLPDELRMTRWGTLLRSTSVDELPQLWNVVLGDMRFVGPRPLPTSYTPLYTPRQAMRLRVVPGITAWTSVNGRNTTTWEDRFELDAWYVEHQSLGLDLKILWRTVSMVVKREGVSAEGHVTMPPFEGHQTPAPGDPQVTAEASVETPDD